MSCRLRGRRRDAATWSRQRSDGFAMIGAGPRQAGNSGPTRAAAEHPIVAPLAIELVAFETPWLDELVPMWRRSFEAGVGITDPHPIAEQRDYFLNEVLPQNSVRLALRVGDLVGFVAASRTSLAQLYVRVGCQRQGIGTQLLNWAKRQSAGSLCLYTFARNVGACAFYEAHGFVAVARGFEPSWRLDDIKYEWRAPPANRG
jgi:GNAT superfamily N-acetyltransferase